MSHPWVTYKNMLISSGIQRRSTMLVFSEAYYHISLLFVCYVLMPHPWATYKNIQMPGGLITVVCFLCFKGTQDLWNASIACLWHMR